MVLFVNHAFDFIFFLCFALLSVQVTVHLFLIHFCAALLNNRYLLFVLLCADVSQFCWIVFFPCFPACLLFVTHATVHVNLVRS